MNYKLVAIDMDGTLLNSENQISERTKKTIKMAQEKGVHIVIATGRILKSALYYSQTLNLKTPLVACNGAIIVDEEENIIYERSLEKNRAMDIVNLAKTEEIYFHFYDKSNFYSNIRSEEVLEFYNEGSGSMEIKVNIFEDAEDIMEMKDINIYKFIFIDNSREKLNKLRSKIDELEGISTSSSWINNIEVMKNDVSKGRAIEELCERFNINPKEVIAIGDSENDLSMIRFAGLGVAMENGDENIKSQSDYTTDSNNEDGVAKVIEKFILGIGDE